EGVIVANNISELHNKEDFSYQQIAILYRTNSQSRVLEESLRKQGIPYRIYGGLSFYQRKEIKDVIAYCRLICNPNDEEALKRIINYPARGIGDTTVNKLIECAQLHAVSAWEVLMDMLKYNLPVNGGTANKLAQFRSMISVFADQINTQNAYELVNSIVKVTGVISDTYVDRSPENLSKQENVQELLKAIHEYCDNREKNNETGYLPDFLSEVSLLTDQDTDKDADTDKVTMMTVHAAKGLEFRAVFIVGMEEDLFPSSYTIGSERELEEERRLFYVAITRAEERCFISYAKSRFRNGKVNFSNPSRFIKDIDAQFLDAPKEKEFEPGRKRFGDWDEDLESERNIFGQRSYSNPKPVEPFVPQILKRLVKIENSDNNNQTVNSSIPVGGFVKHASFGIGKVLKTYIDNGNEKAEIDFGEKGVKSLLLKFAKLEVLN
ncbi:MAG TPA: exodeoxyribonuclease V subunit gamma, partial [Paludibacter sp.]|nr:exodeoxyribonuclease V subunit gamma [Paludibacter sp.]